MSTGNKGILKTKEGKEEVYECVVDSGNVRIECCVTLFRKKRREEAVNKCVSVR